MNRNRNLYGNVSGATLDPKSFMLRAMKKILLNNKNILSISTKDIGQDQKVLGIEARVFNTVKLLEEMDFRLNRDVPNEVVENISTSFLWVKNEMEKIGNGWEMMLTAGELTQRVENTSYVIRNIMEGFKDID